MKRRATPLALTSLVFIASLGSPVSGQDQEERQMMGDIRILQMQTQELQLMLGTLAKTLENITAMVKEEAAVNRKAFADSRILIDAVASGIRILREKIDDTNIRVSTFSQEIEALRVSIPRIRARFEDGETEGDANPSISDMSQESVAPPDPGMSPQRLYDNAWADYSTGQWSLAIAGFTSYISAFPRSDLADDAQFYIGETHYNDGRFREAIIAYKQVIGGYPGADVIPQAQYKLGLALDRVGDRDQAREAFQIVVNDFPNSRMAALARQALDRLGRQ